METVSQKVAEKGRVLCIDNDQDFLVSLEKILSNDGYSVSTAESAPSGFERFIAGKFDVVILDLALGSSSGIELISQLKLIDPTIECVVLTGYGEYQSALESFRLGVMDYLEKPFNPVTFLQRLDEGLKKSKKFDHNRINHPQELPSCSLCSRVLGKTEDESNDQDWIPIQDWLKKFFNICLQPTFCSGCSQLNFDQVEAYFVQEIRNFKENFNKTQDKH
jgi:DNA-binding response OmpR family regulator